MHFHTFFCKFSAKYFDALRQCRNVLDFNRKLFRGKFMYMNRDFKQGIWLSIVFSGVKTKTNKIMEICVGVGWGSIQTQEKSFLPKGSRTPLLKIKLSILCTIFQKKYNFASIVLDTLIKSVLYSSFCTVNLKGKHARLCHHLK